MAESKAYKTRLYVLNENNLYKVLGVSEDASLEDISKAYRLIAKELHPDLNHDLLPDEKKQAGAIFQKITAAFNTLKDSEERTKYDVNVEAQKFREESIKKSTESRKKEEEKQQNSNTFTFKQVKFVDLEKVREEQKNLEKQKSTETFNKAKSLLENKRFDEGAEILKTLVEASPNEAKYHSYLGLALEGKGWAGYAQAEFKVALHYDANDEIAKKYYKQPIIVSPKIVKNTGDLNPYKNTGDLNPYKNNSNNVKFKNDEDIDPASTGNLREILSRVRGIFGKKQ